MVKTGGQALIGDKAAQAKIIGGAATPFVDLYNNPRNRDWQSRGGDL